MEAGTLLVWSPGCKFEATAVCIQNRKPSLILAEGGQKPGARYKSCKRLSGSLQLQTRADSWVGFFSGGSFLALFYPVKVMGLGRVGRMRKGAASHRLRPPYYTNTHTLTPGAKRRLGAKFLVVIRKGWPEEVALEDREQYLGSGHHPFSTGSGGRLKLHAFRGKLPSPFQTRGRQA